MKGTMLSLLMGKIPIILIKERYEHRSAKISFLMNHLLNRFIPKSTKIIYTLE